VLTLRELIGGRRQMAFDGLAMKRDTHIERVLGELLAAARTASTAVVEPAARGG
jgi:hypothetical protein